MNWNQWYSLRSYVRSSLWIMPFGALLLQQLTLRAAVALDGHVSWIPAWPFNEAGTMTTLQTIVTLTLSFLVFTFGSMLVAIQVASGQLTPRIIATALLRDNTIRATVGLFVFTLLFAIGAISRSGVLELRLVVWISAILGMVSLAAFLYLIDYSARLLRPVSIVWRIGKQGEAVIEAVYPEPIRQTDSLPVPTTKLKRANRDVPYQGASAIILAANTAALVSEAERLNVVIEMVPRVGDFIAPGDPLFYLHGSSGPVEESRLLGAIAVGPERTIEQDSTFAFRIIVDIAIKALSKAINDPTTAVLAIDQIQHLLNMVGQRHLHDDHISDRNGQLRVVLPTPNWEDFVELAFSEIRLYGAENFQVARRLRAMIFALMNTLPEWRRPALHRELSLLDQSIDRVYTAPGDRDLARIPDSQGLGGSRNAE